MVKAQGGKASRSYVDIKILLNGSTKKVKCELCLEG